MNRRPVLALLTLATVAQAETPARRPPGAAWSSADGTYIGAVRAIESFARGCPSPTCSAPGPDLLKGRGGGVVVRTSDEYYPVEPTPAAPGVRRSFVVSLQVSNPEGQCSWRIGQGLDVQVDGKWRRKRSFALTAILTPEKGKVAVLVHAIPSPTPKGEPEHDRPTSYLLDGIPDCHLYRLELEKDRPQWLKDGALQVPRTTYVPGHVYRRRAGRAEAP